MIHQLPQLPFALDALAPHMSGQCGSNKPVMPAKAGI
jgi:hypothetical protein